MSRWKAVLIKKRLIIVRGQRLKLVGSVFDEFSLSICKSEAKGKFGNDKEPVLDINEFLRPLKWLSPGNNRYLFFFPNRLFSIFSFLLPLLSVFSSSSFCCFMMMRHLRSGARISWICWFALGYLDLMKLSFFLCSQL